MDAEGIGAFAIVGQRALEVAIIGGIDIRLGTELGGERPYHLRIETPFNVVNPAGEVEINYRAKGEEDLKSLGVVGSILGSFCTAFELGAGDRLRVTFSNGLQFLVMPHPQWEAWTLSGPEGIYPMMPGGNTPPFEPL